MRPPTESHPMLFLFYLSRDYELLNSNTEKRR